MINGGDTATVQVDNDAAYTLNTVENPLPEKQEVKPYEGTGVLGAVQVGDEITYQISYLNYKTEAADVVIKDKLDANVAFISASDDGVHSKDTVTWTLKGVKPGKAGTVTLVVKVLEGALVSDGPTRSAIRTTRPRRRTSSSRTSWTRTSSSCRPATAASTTRAPWNGR